MGFGFYWHSARYPSYYEPYYAYPYTAYAYPVATPVYYGAAAPVIYNQTTVITAPPAAIAYPAGTEYGSAEYGMPQQPAAGYGHAPGYGAATGAPGQVEGVGPTEVAQDPDAQPNAEQLFVMMFEGTRAFEAGEYETAARLFMRVSMQDTENVDAALAYAVSRFATGDFSIAAIAIRRGIRAYPDVVNAPFDIRDRYGNPTDFDRHLQTLQNYVQGNPESGDALLMLGFVQHFSRRREEAAQTFNRLSQVSTLDQQIAEMFLNARSLEEIDAEMERYEAEMSELYGQPDETQNMAEHDIDPSVLLLPEAMR